MPYPAPLLKLNNGRQIPSIGLGTCKSLHHNCENSIQAAIDCGYRLLDTAHVYGNERSVGRAIAQKIKEGVVKREDLFIVTKLSPSHHEDPTIVEMSCRTSLERLGLDYIDLYLIHTPWGYHYTGIDEVDEGHFKRIACDVDYLDTWKFMERLVDIGLVRSIGVSNFNLSQLKRVLYNCRIRPTVNQIECHVQLIQRDLIQFARSNNVQIMAYCPLGRINPYRRTPRFMFSNEMVQMMRRYEKTPAQICLRFLIEKGCIPIPKSVNTHRIKSNFDIFDFQLETCDVAKLNSLNTGYRILRYDHFRDHKYYPF